MRAIFITCLILCVSSSASAQGQPQPQLPPSFDRIAFFGDIFARMSFCGLFNFVDQYELMSATKAFGVTGSDRPAIEAVREKNYQKLRDTFKTPAAHGDFCIENWSHPFLVKAGRRQSTSIAGSDTTKQPEKIEVFGELLGSLTFCKMQIDGDKWGRFLFDMGVKSESIPAMAERAKAAQQSLAPLAGTSQANEFCAQTKLNPSLSRFSK